MRRQHPWGIAALGLLASLTLHAETIASRADRGPDPPEALDAQQRRIALGVTFKDGRDVESLDRFTEAIGEAPATWTIRSQWGSPATDDFPMAAARSARERGATPLIWWTPVDPGDLSDPRYARHANIVAGHHDDYIRRFARDARDFGSTVILRFAHEANGDHFPWGAARFDNTAATYVAAWRHIHRIFQDVDASDVKFLWSIAKRSCPGGCNPYQAFYPGDAYVDYMGFSSYNWGAHRERWVSMIKGFSRVTSRLSEISGKPIIAVEVGCNPEGGSRLGWIRNGYEEVYRQLPMIIAIVYLNADARPAGHPDWRLTSPPGALAAYADIAASPRFQGRLPSA